MNSANKPDFFELCDGEIYGWLEFESSIMLKAISHGTDPVELSCDDAKILAYKLLELAAKFE